MKKSIIEEMAEYQLLYNIMMMKIEDAINKAYKDKLKEEYGQKDGKRRNNKE